MIEPHIDPTALHDKIIQLFDYRLFPSLMDRVTWADAERAAFHSDLIALQESIYHLDAHLEAGWIVEKHILHWHWNQINSNLSKFGVIDTKDYLSHIKKYEYHELGMRENKSLLRLNLEYFYFYKSCDVKLLRRLIYERGSLSPQAGNLSDWRYYDLITEVNDDVEDVFEDLTFVNGNLVLIQLAKYGKDQTRANFMQFMDLIKEKAESDYRQKRDYDYKQFIYTETMARVEETKDLLEQNLANITDAEIEGALVNMGNPSINYMGH